MDTTVTGLFQDQRSASKAAAKLVDAGFRPEAVHVVHADSPDRHQFIGEQAEDTRRALFFGIMFGTLAGGLAGAALASVFGLLPASVGGGIVGAIGGAILGFFVGRATTTQVFDEIEHQVDAGTVLVSVRTNGGDSNRALDVLGKEGGTSLVKTATTYTAGVLPVHPPEHAKSVS